MQYVMWSSMMILLMIQEIREIKKEKEIRISRAPKFSPGIDETSFFKPNQIAPSIPSFCIADAKTALGEATGF